MPKYRDSIISTPKQFFEKRNDHNNPNEINSKFQQIKGTLNLSIKKFWQNLKGFDFLQFSNPKNQKNKQQLIKQNIKSNDSNTQTVTNQKSYKGISKLSEYKSKRQKLKQKITNKNNSQRKSDIQLNNQIQQQKLCFSSKQVKQNQFIQREKSFQSAKLRQNNHHQNHKHNHKIYKGIKQQRYIYQNQDEKHLMNNKSQESYSDFQPNNYQLYEYQEKKFVKKKVKRNEYIKQLNNFSQSLRNQKQINSLISKRHQKLLLHGLFQCYPSQKIPKNPQTQSFQNFISTNFPNKRSSSIVSNKIYNLNAIDCQPNIKRKILYKFNKEMQGKVQLGIVLKTIVKDQKIGLYQQQRDLQLLEQEKIRLQQQKMLQARLQLQKHSKLQLQARLQLQQHTRIQLQAKLQQQRRIYNNKQLQIIKLNSLQKLQQSQRQILSNQIQQIKANNQIQESNKNTLQQKIEVNQSTQLNFTQNLTIVKLRQKQNIFMLNANQLSTQNLPSIKLIQSGNKQEHVQNVAENVKKDDENVQKVGLQEIRQAVHKDETPNSSQAVQVAQLKPLKQQNPFLSRQTKTNAPTLLQNLIKTKKNQGTAFQTIPMFLGEKISQTQQVHNASFQSNIDSSMCDEDEDEVSGVHQFAQDSTQNQLQINNSFTSADSSAGYNQPLGLFLGQGGFNFNRPPVKPSQYEVLNVNNQAKPIPANIFKVPSFMDPTSGRTFTPLNSQRSQVNSFQINPDAINMFSQKSPSKKQVPSLFGDSSLQNSPVKNQKARKRKQQQRIR